MRNLLILISVFAIIGVSSCAKDEVDEPNPNPNPVPSGPINYIIYKGDTIHLTKNYLLIGQKSFDPSVGDTVRELELYAGNDNFSYDPEQSKFSGVYSGFHCIFHVFNDSGIVEGNYVYDVAYREIPSYSTVDIALNFDVNGGGTGSWNSIYSGEDMKFSIIDGVKCRIEFDGKDSNGEDVKVVFQDRLYVVQ